MNESTWYRDGLITLTNGSDLVDGVGTQFIDNVLIGGIFFSPTGLLEVSRVVSDTRLQLVQPYGGATVGGVEYAVAPTQGAVVAATKQLQAFLTTLGPLKQAWEAGDLNAKGLALKGVKDAVADLPASGNTAGDGWLVDSTLYVWTGTAWYDAGALGITPELQALRGEVAEARDTTVLIAGQVGNLQAAVDDAIEAKDAAVPAAAVAVGAALAAQSAQTKGLIGFANAAEMNADLFWPDRTVCELADSGDHYRKSGASGSGTWIKGGTLLSASAFAQLKSGRSKFAWAVRGTNNKVAIWINKAGHFCVGATENVLGLVQTNQSGLSGLQTSYNGVISTKSRSKFAWAVRGTNNKVAIWLNKAGQFCIGSMENVQGVIQTVQMSLGGVAASQAAAYRIKASRSIYAIILGLDTTGRVALGLSKAGRMIYRGVDIHALLDLATFNATQKLLVPNSSIYAEGDSLLEGAGATGGQTVGVLLAARYAAAGKPRTVFTVGFGGSSAANILARTNIVPSLITFPNGANGFPELPAAGSVNVIVTNNPLNYPGDPSQAKSRACSVAGIAGTLTRASGSSGGQYSWARTTPGTATRVEAGAPVTFDLAGRNYGTGFCFIGTNDVLAGTPAATILGYIDSYVASQPTVEKRCAIVMPLFDNANANVASRQAIYADLLSKVRSKYPGLVVDTLGRLQAANNGSADDLADVAAGLVPRSLSSVSDPAGVRTHLNSAGYDVIAAGIKAIFDSKGW